MKVMEQQSAVRTKIPLFYLQQASAIFLLLLLHPCSETNKLSQSETSLQSKIQSILDYSQNKASHWVLLDVINKTGDHQSQLLLDNTRWFKYDRDKP
jgi:hypothetical protein